jgi:serine/threonine protein kinase
MTEVGGGEETLAAPAASALEDLVPGLLIADRYRVENALGRGSMGVVVAARHLALNQRVALKFMRVEDRSREFRTRFAREARVCAKLNNEHVVRVIDFGTWRDHAVYMAMECLEGEDLAAHLRDRGQLEVKVAIDYAVQACEGLAEVHANGVVHRDLKPSNLFLTRRDDGSPLIKILDFGISKWVEPNSGVDAELTETGAVLGTPRFMSPEQLFGANDVDARADVWALGAIVYQLLTGKPPFEATSLPNLCALLLTGESPTPPSTLRPELTPAIDAAILGCLERDVALRTPNVAELAGDLLAAIGAAHAEETRERLRATLKVGKPVARVDLKKGRKRVLAIAALLCAIVAALFVLTGRSQPPVATPVSAPPPSAVPSPTASIVAPAPSPQPSPLIVVAKPTPTWIIAAKPKPVPTPSVVPTIEPTPAPAPTSSAPGMLEERQ